MSPSSKDWLHLELAAGEVGGGPVLESTGDARQAAFFKTIYEVCN